MVSTLLVSEGMPPDKLLTTAAPPTRSPRGRTPRRTAWVLLAVGLVWSLHGAGVFTRAVANPGGWPQVARFLRAAVHPAVGGDFLRVIGTATLVTAAYAVLGCALALVIGVVVGPLVSRVCWRGRRPRSGASGWAVSRTGLAFPRGLHEAVWALVLVNILGLNPLVAVLAIGVPYGAVTAKVFADLLDEAPDAAYAAMIAAGTGRARALLYGLAPLAAQDLVSYSFYRLECSVRSAVVLGIVGAGGLGFQLDLSFSALRYDEMWTVIDALVLLCATTDLASSAFRRRLAAPRPRSRRGPDGRPRVARDPVLPACGAVAVALAVWAWSYLRVDLSSVWSGRTAEQARFILRQAWPPAHDGPLLGELIHLTVQTFQMSLLAFVLSTVAGLAFSVVAATPSAGRAGAARWTAHVVSRALLLLCRAVPPPVWALMVLFVLYPGPLPGAIALAAYNTGVLGRLMAEGQDSLPVAPRRALQAAGAPRTASWLYATVPRSLPKSLAYGLYRWEVAARETVIVGLVGAGGLGQLLARRTAAFDWPAVTSTLLALVLLTLVVDVLSSLARRATR